MRPHRHPALSRPIHPTKLEEELAALWRRGRRGPPPRLAPSLRLSRTHAKDNRRYAETDGRTIFVAPEILLLPKGHRAGLLAHECGHVVLLRGGSKHSEAEADKAAADVFGVEVTYDARFCGRGVQRGRIIP